MTAVILVVFYFVSKENYPANAGFGTPTPTPNLTNCKVKTYQDKFVQVGIAPECIDKIKIKGMLFVAKDQAAGVKSYWSTNMIDVFNKIKTFYEIYRHTNFLLVIQHTWFSPFHTLLQVFQNWFQVVPVL